MFAAVGALSARQASQQVASDAGEALFQLGSRMSVGLDTVMFERYREVQNLATLEPLFDAELDPARWRKMIEQMQRSFPDYTWIGLADPAGVVLAATGGVLEGQSVAQRTWFEKARLAPFAGDVHGAVLLASLLPGYASGEPLRLVDVAAPIRRDGRLIGVLGAHLDWKWGEEARSRVLKSLPTGRGIEMLVFDAKGQVLLGAAGGADVRPLASLDALMALRHSIQPWNDGRFYLTAAARGNGFRDNSGLGWTVLARQPVTTAFEVAEGVQRQLWGFGLLGAALFGLLGWWLAGRLTAPLRAVAAETLNMLPLQPGRDRRADEVALLAHALGDLVAQLRAREQELLQHNDLLEHRVEARTLSLERANADMKSFSRHVAHDLKGPIGGIGSAIRQVLSNSQGRLDAASARMLGLMMSECDRLRGLVDDLMTLSSVEQGALRREPVDMAELVRVVVDVIHAQVLTGAATGSRETAVEIGPLPEVVGDPVLLRQVWQNLLANAYKFSSRTAAPRIRVHAELTPAEYVFYVEDNGPGFDAAQAEQLFTPFHRLAGTADLPGSGIGLTIVKRIVHRHGGRVGAAQAAGGGASFFFALLR